MKFRTLGPKGPRVSALGLGCMGMSEFYGAHDDAASIKLIHHALDEGLDFLDIADIYGPHTNEVLVGKAIKGRRNTVFLATKFGIMRDPNDPSKRGVNGRPEYVRAACDASLKRLGVDHIDLYYQHRIDRATPIEDTMGALADLVQAGKIRYAGLSEPSAATLERAHAVHPVTAVQSEYSLWTRNVEKNGVLAACEELGIGFVPWSPLGAGFLTGKIDANTRLDPNDFRNMSPRFTPEAREHNLALVDLVRKVAERRQATPAQVALAWLLAQRPWIVPIPGTTKLHRLEENLGAVDVQLTADDLRELDEGSSRIEIHGQRLPEAILAMSETD